MYNEIQMTSSNESKRSIIKGWKSKIKNWKSEIKNINFRKFKTLRWILIALCGFLVGFFIVMFMVQTFNVLGLYTFFLTLAAVATVVLFIKGFRRRSMIYSVGLIVVFFLVGWVSANAVFLSQDELHYMPAITRTDGGDGHSAVIYITHGEPPGYDPMPWILTMREFDNDNVPFVPWPFRPFFFNTLRNHYIEAGGSPHNALHQTYIDNLRFAMPGAVANGTRFYLAFLDSPPHPEEMAIKAINEGASKIIILPVFITESTHTIAAQDMVANVNPEQYGINVTYTGALGDSDTLQNVFVDRALNMSVDYDQSDVGILLVGHGQPDEWEILYPDQNLQESQYRNGIRDKLITAGFSANNVVLGWMQFQSPSVTDSVLVLAANDVELILVFSVSLSALAIHSEVDVPKAIDDAQLSSNIIVEYVGQYGDHPLAIQCMADKILPHL